MRTSIYCTAGKSHDRVSSRREKNNCIHGKYQRWGVVHTIDIDNENIYHDTINIAFTPSLLTTALSASRRPSSEILTSTILASSSRRCRLRCFHLCRRSLAVNPVSSSSLRSSSDARKSISSTSLSAKDELRDRSDLGPVPVRRWSCSSSCSSSCGCLCSPSTRCSSPSLLLFFLFGVRDSTSRVPRGPRS